jgi:glycosyltransferase involved in cell wall biosynthesis
VAYENQSRERGAEGEGTSSSSSLFISDWTYFGQRLFSLILCKGKEKKGKKNKKNKKRRTKKRETRRKTHNFFFFFNFKLQFLGKESSAFPGILYHEAISQEDLHNILFSESDGLVNSSISEGLSNVILESMFLEVPVFARMNEGNSSVVLQNETGKLFETPEEFLEGAKELIHGEGRRTRTTGKNIIDKKGQEEKKEEEVGVRHLIVKNARELVERHHSLGAEAKLYYDLVVEMIRKKATN